MDASGMASISEYVSPRKLINVRVKITENWPGGYRRLSRTAEKCMRESRAGFRLRRRWIGQIFIDRQFLYSGLPSLTVFNFVIQMIMEIALSPCGTSGIDVCSDSFVLLSEDSIEL